MNLLLIEDDATIARELSLRWARRGWKVDHAATLAAADAALHPGGCDAVVLDLGLPDGDGLQWLAALRRYDSAMPVLVLTARDRVVDRVRGLQAGADDYLVKPFAVDELEARMECVTRRAARERGERAQCGRVAWLGSEGRAYLGDEALELSPREFEVLGLLMRRAPRLVPKRAIIDALAERNVDMGDCAAETYVCRLRRKLLGSGTVIRTVRGFGYLMTVEARADG